MIKRHLVLCICVLFVALSFLISGSISAAETKNQPTEKTSRQTPKQQASVEEKPEDAFKKAFPRVPFDSIKPTNMKGIYEVWRGSDLIYFMADPGYLFIGDIISRDGRSLTEEKKAELASAKAKDLPLDKAIKIGNGKNTIVEFTDPDCPYCRKASEFLEQKKDTVTRYVFFFPLPMLHPDAENKVKYVFCAEDKAKAYEEAMKGKLDDKKYDKCDKPEAVELLKVHKELANSVGISGTPFFIVNGKKAVTGANFPEIEAALIK